MLVRAFVGAVLCAASVAGFVLPPASPVCRSMKQGAPDLSVRSISKIDGSEGSKGEGGSMQALEQVAGTLKGYIVKAAESVSGLENDETQAKVAEWAMAVQQNVFKGFDASVKGEWLALPPVLLLGLVVVGRVPYIADAAQIVAGPGLMLLGIGFALAGMSDLGKDLTPWPQPLSNSSLRTDGAYGLVRHPIYGGMLMFALGLSLATEEFDRMFATALLLVAIEIKVQTEETYLRERFPGYDQYSRKVKKYIPFIY